MTPNPNEPIITLALCEQERIFLRPGQVYRFVQYSFCERCAELARMYTHAAPDIHTISRGGRHA